MFGWGILIWDFLGIFLGILWEFYQNSLGILSEFFGDVWLGGSNLGIIWEFYQNYIGILWDIFEFIIRKIKIILAFPYCFLQTIVLADAKNTALSYKGVWIMSFSCFDMLCFYPTCRNLHQGNDVFVQSLPENLLATQKAIHIHLEIWAKTLQNFWRNF